MVKPITRETAGDYLDQYGDRQVTIWNAPTSRIAAEWLSNQVYASLRSALATLRDDKTSISTVLVHERGADRSLNGSEIMALLDALDKEGDITA